jgi:4-hydroxybenzoate polyprenyltransferase
MAPATLLRAMRPQQWVKNVFVLAAVVFARGDRGLVKPADYGDVWRSLAAFAAFCLGASAIYLINDVLDVEGDRAHPEKRLRPIASGELGIRAALTASAFSLAGAVALAALAGPGVVMVLALYVALNFAYSVKLKHTVMVDVFCIAFGFLLRVEAGALAARYPMSHWLMLCTLFLALFLALSKRRAEIDLLGEERGSHRANLRQYTPAFLDQMVTMLAAVTIVCYTIYTVSDETFDKFGSRNLAYSIPFVVFGVGRYMLLVQTRRGGGSPTRVLLGGDATFVANALAWLAVVVWAIFES